MSVRHSIIFAPLNLTYVDAAQLLHSLGACDVRQYSFLADMIQVTDPFREELVAMYKDRWLPHVHEEDQ
jgi:hypothetical protein